MRLAQGYVFAPPLPGSAFLRLVEAIDPLPAAALEGKVRRRCTPLHVGAREVIPALKFSSRRNKKGRPAWPPKFKRHAEGTSERVGLRPNAAGPRVQIRVSGRHRGADSSIVRVTPV